MMGIGCTKSAKGARVPTTSVGVRIHGVSQQIRAKKTKLTDQDDVFCALFLLIPQLPNVKIRIIRRLEHISPPLRQGPALKVRGRHVGFLQQRWA
jgi:hypothetical protein